jgi:hypothetical protein
LCDLRRLLELLWVEVLAAPDGLAVMEACWLMVWFAGAVAAVWAGESLPARNRAQLTMMAAQSLFRSNTHLKFCKKPDKRKGPGAE